MLINQVHMDRHHLLALLDKIQEKYEIQDGEYKEFVEAIGGKKKPIEFKENLHERRLVYVSGGGILRRGLSAATAAAVAVLNRAIFPPFCVCKRHAKPSAAERLDDDRCAKRRWIRCTPCLWSNVMPLFDSSFV